MRFTFALIMSFLLLASGAVAQDAPTPDAQAPEATPRTYPLEQLRAEVVPLYQDEVVELANMWKGHLREAAGLVEQLKLAGAPGSEVADAETARNAIAERLVIVVTNLEAKGGDGTPFRNYIAATSGISVDWFDPQAVTDYATAWLASPEGGIAVGLNIVKFIVILVIAWIIAKIFAAVVRTAVRRLPKTSSLLQDFVVNLTRRTLLLIGVVVALGALGLNITPLIAAIGAAGLVIGLALQGTLSNFASGILILIYRPFDVGDVINAGGVAGKVEAMSLVSTRMLTFDNQVQYVPNNSIWNGVITNITGLDTRRVDMTFGIGYADDMAKAEAIIRDVITSHEKVLADPAPVIKVSELADSSVNFIARPWSKTGDYWDVYWDVTRKVKERFDAEGVGIPFPQRDIHIPDALRVVVTNE
jgi:small conductance mechanosensitive channel